MMRGVRDENRLPREASRDHIPRSARSQAGWGLEQLVLAEGVHAHGR